MPRDTGWHQLIEECSPHREDYFAIPGRHRWQAWLCYGMTWALGAMMLQWSITGYWFDRLLGEPNDITNES